MTTSATAPTTATITTTSSHPAAIAPPLKINRNRGIIPTNTTELMELASILFKGEACGKLKRTEGVAAVIAMGLEIGLTPVVAINSIYIQNGKCTIWGDAPLALCEASGQMEYCRTELTRFDNNDVKATCYCKRVGRPEMVYEYSLSDALQAGLIGKMGDKKGPWDNDPEWMVQQRARTRCLRLVFADVLNGLHIQDESEEVGSAGSGYEAKEPRAVIAAGTSSRELYRNEVIAEVEQLVEEIKKELDKELDVATTATATESPKPINGAQLETIKELMPNFWIINWNCDPRIEESPEKKAQAKQSWVEYLAGDFGVDSATKLTQVQADKLIADMREPLGTAMFGSSSNKADDDNPIELVTVGSGEGGATDAK